MKERWREMGDNRLPSRSSVKEGEGGEEGKRRESAEKVHRGLVPSSLASARVRKGKVKRDAVYTHSERS